MSGRATSMIQSRSAERGTRNFPSFALTLEPRENIERPTSNTERRSERGFALPFDVRRWMFDVECSSGFVGRPHRAFIAHGALELPSGPLTPSLSPSAGERVSKELVRGSPDDFWIAKERWFMGSLREFRIAHRDHEPRHGPQSGTGFQPVSSEQARC